MNQKVKSSISKTNFIRGLQCAKSLYLYKYYPHLRKQADEKLKQLFQTGYDVGILARDLFPGGICASNNESYNIEESLQRTAKLIKESFGVIYEGAFEHDGLLCINDIFVNDGGNWAAYEVKAGTGISETYLWDAAFQYYVISSTGVILNDFSIIYLNKEYHREGDLDLKNLFIIESVIDPVLQYQEEIKRNVDRFNQLLSHSEIPDREIGIHCFDPYECDFKDHCWESIPESSIFNISRLTKKKKFDLYRKGIINIEDVPADYSLSDNQQIQVDSHKHNQVFIDADAIKSFIESLVHPLHFLDFETFMPAVPLWDKTRPYQQIVFQYSLHVQDDTRLEHYEFLADGKEDPRKLFLEHLKRDIQPDGDIHCYNSKFEISRLKELARDYPEYSGFIDDLIIRIKDLMEPFDKKYYYDPLFNGSYSLKNVLPVLVPDMGYKNLGISDGSMAMHAFQQLINEKDEEVISRIRTDLLKYCSLDTLALVRILQKLNEVITN